MDGMCTVKRTRPTREDNKDSALHLKGSRHVQHVASVYGNSTHFAWQPQYDILNQGSCYRPSLDGRISKLKYNAEDRSTYDFESFSHK